MAVFQYTPSAALQNPAVTYPLQLTEAQWRTQLAKWFTDVDAIEAKCQGAVDSEYVNVPDGIYWVGSSQGSFTPPASSAENPATEVTDATQADNEVSG